MNSLALTSIAHYSGSPFSPSRDRLVTCAAYLLSIVTGKEIPMSSKQNRNQRANPADAEALESLRHMTSFARWSVTSPEPAPRKKFGPLIEGFALGATAFHPGPWTLPIDAVVEADIARETQPDRPGLAVRATRSLGAAMAVAWCAFRRHREIARATRALSEMDDHSLRDIGLSRADIGRAARYGRDWEPWH
jgi:uncharacterized protein YjiS (DUF1127 family)